MKSLRIIALIIVSYYICIPTCLSLMNCSECVLRFMCETKLSLSPSSSAVLYHNFSFIHFVYTHKWMNEWVNSTLNQNQFQLVTVSTCNLQRCALLHKYNSQVIVVCMLALPLLHIKQPTNQPTIVYQANIVNVQIFCSDKQ